MIHAIGYAGMCLGLPECSVSRTVRVVHAAPPRLRELIALNLRDLHAILAYNVTEHFCLFRLNQSLIPLASHPVNTLTWWEEFGSELRALGAFVTAHGLRVSMHPGQYTVLNSQHPTVVDAALADLLATCRVLEAMALPVSHKIVVHGGAGTPTRAEALARWRAVWPRVPESVRARLVLENDDTVFSVAELLPVCEELGIPLVFDWLHHRARPGTWATKPLAEIVAATAATWRRVDGPPKVHFSSQDPQKRPGAHAYWLEADDFRLFVTELSGVTVDVMVECKGKDLALARLRDQLDLRLPACGEIT